MKKIFLSAVAVIAAAACLFVGCSSEQAPTPDAAGGPQYGGTMQFMINQLPKSFGLPHEFIGVKTATLVCLEKLADLDESGNLVPWLATSWDVDLDSPIKALTFHLRQGVKFHDGSELDAEVVKWNIEGAMKLGRIVGINLVKSIDTPDKYTVRINMTKYTPLFLYNFASTGPIQIFSLKSFNEHGEEWARTHPVGTGPFKFAKYSRDNYMYFEKFDAYWREGKPYLDNINYRVVLDPMVGATTMQAKQADVWYAIRGVSYKDAADAKDHGLTVKVMDASFFWELIPDSKNSDSIWADRKVREAAEYAIDKKVISDALGYGFTQPMYQNAMPGSPAYNEDIQGRRYDVEKARQLLKEAGYAGDLKTKVICNTDALIKDIGTAVQGFLAEVGIAAELEIVDQATYTTMVMGKRPWSNGIIINNIPLKPGVVYAGSMADQYGDNNKVSRLISPELKKAVEAMISTPDIDALPGLMQAVTRQYHDDVTSIVLMTAPNFLVTQPWVHTSFYDVDQAITWYGAGGDDWMERH